MSSNVLISSAGRRVALMDAFRTALARTGLRGRVLATDMTPRSAAMRAADEGFTVPPCGDPAFVDTMLEICVEQQVRLVVPTIDPELMPYAANRDRFQAVGTTVAISGPGVVEIGTDKLRTARWLSEAGLPTVRQGLLAEVICDVDRWVFPLLVKPRHGSASKGIELIHEPRELEDLAEKDDLMVQEVAPGREHTIDLLIDRDGELLSAVPRRRLEVRAGEVSKGVTVRDPDLAVLAERVCDALPGAYGALNVQVFVDPTTRHLKIIELNPRFGGGYPLAWAAGADFPAWLVSDVAGQDPPTDPAAWRDGLVMLRYDAAVFADAADVGL